MGYLTTFTIYNDGAHTLTKESNKLCEKLYDACNGSLHRNHYGSIDIGHCCFANFISAQRPRHADDHTLYIHMGNCLTELNAYTEDTKQLAKNHKEFYGRLVNFLEQTLKECKTLQEKYK